MAQPTAGERDAMPSGLGRRTVVLALAALTVVGVLLVPFADRPGPVMPGFVALFAAGFLVAELSASFLLLVQFRARRHWSLLVLGCAYVYSGLMPIPHLLTFPGAILADRPVIAAPPQSTAWIFLLWVNGFAALSLIAAVVQARFGDRRVAAEATGPAMIFGLAFAAALAVAVVAVSVTTAGRLPPLVSGSRWTGVNWAVSSLGVVLLVAGVAVILATRGGQDRIFLWLGLALAAMAFGNVLAMAGGGRFTVGWSLGRLGWLISACVLLVYLMVLHARDQGLLTRARDILGDGTEGSASGRADDVTGRMAEVALERFVARQNIRRYERLLMTQRDEATRRVLEEMLAEEEARLERLGRPAS